jgi:hypothetical protein
MGMRPPDGRGMPGNALGMRLFLIGLCGWALTACKGEDRKEGAVRVELSYATFRPRCLTLTVSDTADPSRSTVQVLDAPEAADGRPPRSRELTVAIYRQEDWGRDLTVTAAASESGCAVENKKSVATQSLEVRVPEEGVEVVRMDLRATDLDDDGFVRAAEGGMDCDDTDPAVKPGASGLACTTAQACAGTYACTAEGVATACVSSQPAVPWYTDGDGDGRAGTQVGEDCKPPVEGAVTSRTDCDDNSPFAFTDAGERCDRVDNNCDGQVDESGCGPVSWESLSVPGTPAGDWRAVAAYDDGRVWAVGDGNKVVHIAGGSATAYTNCPGNWLSAWARPSDGRVFLGSDNGVLGSRAAGNSDCGGEATGSTARLNGLVGFETGTGTTLFAVNSEGRIYRWDYAKKPAVLFNAGLSLRAIHGTKPSNMVAVGSKDGMPKVFRSNADGSQWTEEPLPTGLPADTTLTSVRVVHDGLAFAAGENGVVLMRSQGTWTALPSLAPSKGEPTHVRGLTAYGSTAVYVAVSDRTVRWFNGKDWVTDISDSWTPNALGGAGPHDVWVVGSQNTVLRRGP